MKRIACQYYIPMTTISYQLSSLKIHFKRIGEKNEERMRENNNLNGKY